MLSPIKIKICDRDYNMNTSYGERKVRVETVEGIITVKSKEDVLPTDRIVSYLSNDFVQPIKIKIVDLNIIIAFLLGAVARVAFYAGIDKDMLFILSYGKFSSVFKFFSKAGEALSKYILKCEAVIASKAIFYDSFSIYKISMNPSKLFASFSMRMTTTISESALNIKKIGINIQDIADVIITKITYKKIQDITQNTLEQDILGSNTILDLIETREDTRSLDK